MLKMKICLLTYRGNMHCGGQGVYVYCLAEALVKLGHEVHIMSGPPYASAPEGVKLHRIPGLNLYESGVAALSTPAHWLDPLNIYELAAIQIGMFPDILAFSMRAYARLRELMPRERFDVIHDNQTLGYGLLLAGSLGVPIVATIHHPITIDMAASIAEVDNWITKMRRTMFYSFLVMQGIVGRRMERIIAVARASAEDTIRAFKLREDRVRVVYNGIDTVAFSRQEVRKESNGIVIVAKAGDRKKGVPFLLKAVQLLKGDIDVRVNIVGDQGDDDGFGENLVRDLGLADRVTFTGVVSKDELARLYSAAEIAITASIYEGFGLPAAEAMSCGTPVIVTRAGALPEIVGKDGAGMLVPPADPAALAAAIKRLLADGPLRREMGEASRKRIEECFSWEATARNTVEVYREVVRARQGQGLRK
ncbi:MAG: glycosyltransferase family 4 protein [Dehalococcoidia bacterium]|nr:glycosyltransferase family 4 protein [Dehalococcoidia bacterium]